MSTFKDASGRDWLVEPTLLMARRLKSRSENPVDIMDPNSLAAAFDDHFARFDLLWEFCKAQAAELNVSVDDFDKLLAASEETWAGSTRALKEALVDFFQRFGMKALAQVITKTTIARDRLNQVAVTRVQSDRIEKLIDLAVQAAESQSDSALDRAEKDLQQQIHGDPSKN